MKFYFRALYINEDRWVHHALLEHLSGNWSSPYLRHISNLRGLLHIHSAEPAPSILKGLINEHFLAQTNIVVSSMNWIQPILELTRQNYVCENEFSSVISQFKLDCAGLGDKKPRTGHCRKQFCPVCPINHPNTGLHLLLECGSLSDLRRKTGLSSFLEQCLMKNLSPSQCYSYFVGGMTSDGHQLSRLNYLQRGKAMRDMRDLWLSKW